jgi:hypothetical protein
VAELALRGLSQYEIAARPEFRHITRRQIGKDLELVAQRWREAAVAAMAAHRARLLAESDLRKKELWAAWEASKGERRSTTTRQRKLPAVPAPPGADALPPDGMPSLVPVPGSNGHTPAERVEREARVRLEERDPDVHFMDALRKEDELQAKLLGLIDEPPSRDLGEPVRRVVVYMERPPDGQGEAPPANGPVIDIEPGQLPPPRDLPP